MSEQDENGLIRTAGIAKSPFIETVLIRKTSVYMNIILTSSNPWKIFKNYHLHGHP